MKKIVLQLLTLSLILSTLLSAPLVSKADTNQNPNTTKGITYHVDSNNGNDSNNGTSKETAWKSIDKINKTTFLPNDLILLKRGSIWQNTFLWPKGSGEENEPITISAYGNEDDSLPFVSSYYSDSFSGLPDTDTCLNLAPGQNYWIIENLALENGTPGAGTQSVVKIDGSSSNRTKGNIIRNCDIIGSNPENWKTVSKSNLTGISVGGFIDSVLIENNTLNNFKALGISVNGSYGGTNHLGQPNLTAGQGVVVRGNYLYNIGKDGILINNCYKPLVEYNTVNKSHSYALGTAHVAIWPFACYGALFQYNEAFDTKTIVDGQGFDSDYLCYYTTFQYNYSHDNTGGFMLICTEAEAAWLSNKYAYNVGTVIRYNISQNDHHYVFSLIDGIQDTKIYNNTVYAGWNNSNSTHLFWAFDKGKNRLNGLNYPDDLLIANNIFYLDSMGGNDLSKCSNVVWKNNLVYGRNNTGFANDEPVIVDDKVISSGNLYGYNPQLVHAGSGSIGIDTCDGYMLYDNSPAIGTGMIIEDHGLYEFDKDYFGNPVSKTLAPNIGAYNGKGVPFDRQKFTFDGKYMPVLDFEQYDADSTGTGIRNVLSFSSNNSSLILTQDKLALNAKTSSKKAIALTNTSTKTASTNVKFLTLPYDWKDANGVRFWVDANNKEMSGTITFTSSGKSYSKGFGLPLNGGYVTFTFNEKYNGSNNARVTPELMREMTALQFSFNQDAGHTIYLDDIQKNVSEMDEEHVDIKPDLEKSDNILVQDFESFSPAESSGSNSYGGPSSGPNYRNGIKVCPNSTKSFFSTSATATSTGVRSYFGQAATFAALRSAIATHNPKGLEFDLFTTVYSDTNQTPLTEDEQYRIKDNTNLYNFFVSSSASLTLIAEDSTEVKTSTLELRGLRADSKGKARINFDDLIFVSNNITYKLKDFDPAQQTEWKNSIYQFSVSYQTYGSILAKNLYTTWYLDNLSVYTNVHHSPSDWTVAKDATCTEDGLSEITCTVCLAVLESKTINSTGHTKGEWETQSVKSCTKDGVEVQKCLTCLEILDTKKDLATGHSLKHSKVEPTCLASGYDKEECTICGDIKISNETNKLEHQEGEWEIAKIATCLVEGEMQKSCLICKEILDSAKIEITDHTFTQTNKVATCVSGGYTELNCKTCDLKKTINLTSPTGHAFSSVWTIDKKPTTKAAGSKSHHCTACDLKTDITKISKIITLSKPSISKTKVSKKSITLKFKKLNNAQYYEIHRKIGKKKFVLYKTTNNLSFTDKNVKKGQKYRYKIRAYYIYQGKKQYSSFSTPKTLKAK